MYPVTFPWSNMYPVTSPVLVPIERMIEETIKYTRERKAFGQPILDNQYVHFTLAELASELEMLRSTVYRTVGESHCSHSQKKNLLKILSLFFVGSGEIKTFTFK